MALSSSVVRQQHVADGSTVNFSIPFPLIESDSNEVKVYIRDESVTPATETLAVEGDDYELTGRPTPSDFHTTVTFDTAPASGLIIQIERELALEQTLDMLENGSYNLAQFETAWDRAMAIIQQLHFLLRRTPRFTRTAADFLDDVDLPDPEASAVLGRNEDNDGWEWKSAADLTNAAGALAIANNLSDLSNVTAALQNLGIDPISQQREFAFTDGQSATALTGETIDGSVYSSRVIEYEVIRGTTVMATGKLSLHYKNSTWGVVDGGYEGDPHGLSFSVSQAGAVATLRLAASASGGGDGTIKIKSHDFKV
jgi:hypothetical protein